VSIGIENMAKVQWRVFVNMIINFLLHKYFGFLD
jgi:hypothetical protein